MSSHHHHFTIRNLDKQLIHHTSRHQMAGIKELQETGMMKDRQLCELSDKMKELDSKIVVLQKELLNAKSLYMEELKEKFEQERKERMERKDKNLCTECTSLKPLLPQSTSPLLPLSSLTFTFSDSQKVSKQLIINPCSSISVLGNVGIGMKCNLYIQTPELIGDMSGNINNNKVFSLQTNSISYNGKYWIACGAGDQGTVATSSNGRDWTIDSMAFVLMKNQTTNAIWCGDRWAICGNSGVIIEEEKGTWKKIMDTPCKDILYDNGRIFTLQVNSLHMTSDFGNTWMEIESKLVKEMTCAMTIKKGKRNNYLITGIKNSGCIIEIDILHNEERDLSTDKLEIVNSIIYNEKYGYIAGGVPVSGSTDSGRPFGRLGIITSIDGKIWEQYDISDKNIQINKILWKDERFVALGDGGIYISSNGIKWEPYQSSNIGITDLSLPFEIPLSSNDNGIIDLNIKIDAKRGDLLCITGDKQCVLNCTLK